VCVCVLLLICRCRTFGVEMDSKMESLLEYKDTSTDSIFYLGLGIVVLLATYYFLKKRKIRASGRHKKDDENRFPSGNGTIKYRDS
jgi:LPXTG-motif cell wall-anchored protein